MTTVRKKTVLFYGALRHGMAYADPEASYHEERYKQRVNQLGNGTRVQRPIGTRLC